MSVPDEIEAAIREMEGGDGSDGGRCDTFESCGCHDTLPHALAALRVAVERLTDANESAANAVAAASYGHLKVRDVAAGYNKIDRCAILAALRGETVP